jgi:hypothetical protein
VGALAGDICAPSQTARIGAEILKFVEGTVFVY